ncbi:hypothetical protein QSI_4023 [Clostridioides difficile P28]|jgi:hypothetical protein|nr:hypothetical protein QSI_4023 [Clostridioides difficile P28]
MDQASTIGYKLGYDPLIIITDRKEKARMMQGNRTSHWYMSCASENDTFGKQIGI